MFHTKDVLSNQLLANANDPSWYVSFKEAVEDLSEEEAFWNPNDECNSIAEICSIYCIGMKPDRLGI